MNSGIWFISQSFPFLFMSYIMSFHEHFCVFFWYTECFGWYLAESNVTMVATNGAWRKRHQD